MKNKKSENYLEKIPQREPSVGWTQDESGLVTLELLNRGVFNKLAQLILRKPKISYIHLDENGSFDFHTIARGSGLKLVEIPKDYIVGKQRYFSDYISGQNLINLYSGSIQKWAEQNGLEYADAVNLILSHEYYHYLEMNEIGQASRDYLVPMLNIGPLKLGKTGIRALSEVGAHAFARKYYELVTERKQQHEATEL